MAPQEAHLIGRRQLYALAACAVMLSSAAVVADDYAAEVYRDAAITINAGLVGDSRRIVQFGDVLTMIITVNYDAGAVSLRETDGEFLDAAWPDGAAVVLLDRQVQHGAGPDRGTRQLRGVLRFQVVGCPADLVTCPENRTYSMPNFTLEYQRLRAGDADDTRKSVTFRPWPGGLTVPTTLTRDEENQLYSFETYFPTGGYPDPLTGRDGMRASILTVGSALAILIGGMLMWPFRSRAQKELAAEKPRWQTLLQELGDDGGDNESRYLDALRRCLVWYCNDELRIDPFVWLDLVERGAEDKEDVGDEGEHAELRELFVELLHSPRGRGPELRLQLEGLIARSQAA